MRRCLPDIFFLSVVFLVVLVTTSLPYWLQYRNTPEGQQFGGLLFVTSDPNSYLMWMRQAAAGQVFWRDLMTTDPHEPFYSNLLWLGLGRLAGRPEHLLLVYHGARVVFSLVLLLTLYALLGALLQSVWERRMALLLIATGDGLTWLFFGLNLPGPTGVPLGAESFSAPELLAWPSMALLPHFPAALAAMTGVFYLTLAAYQRPARWAAWAALGGVLLAVLAAFHVYEVLTVSAVLIVHWIMAYRTGKARPHTLRALLLVLAPGVVVTVLVGVMLARSPLGRAWGQANVMLSWSPLAYAVGLGIPLLVALADHRRLFHWREMTLAQMLPAVWVLVNVPLLFTGGLIPFERRLMLGLQVPVVVLAVANWGQYVVPRLAAVGSRSHTPRTPALLVAWGVLLVATWPGLAMRLNYYSTQPAYLDEDFLALAAKLAALPAGQGVLCRSGPGNWLPQLTGQAVYVGHNELTPHAEQRKAQAKAFFQVTTTDQWRRQLLAEARCTYVLAEGNDREGLVTAVATSLLEPVASLPRASLYRVNLQGGS